MPRVIVYAPPGVEWAGTPIAAHGTAIEIERCQDGQILLERVMQGRPDALIFGLDATAEDDLGLLHLVRRIARDLPLVLVANEGSLITQKLAQELRPIYYAVCPVDASEMCDALQAALDHRGRSGTGHSITPR